MAIEALDWCGSALGVLRFVAVNAGAGGSSGVMERGLELGFHRRNGRGRVAAAARLLWRGRGLFGMARVMTGLARYLACLHVNFVLEAHSAEGRLQDDHILGGRFRWLSGRRRLLWRSRRHRRSVLGWT